MAQNLRDTLHLQEFEVKSTYSSENNCFKRVKIDSGILINHLNGDLSNVLSQYSTIFIKSNGNGSLASPSFRGTAAQHTQVEWNGINLNSPMLGQVDLSQIPVSQFDGLEILYGAAGISRTSGAFGGVINLVTNPDWNNRLNILAMQSIGSFQTYTTNLNVVAGSSSFQSHTKFNYSVSTNDFPFYNDYLKETVHQKSASYALFGMSEELFWKLNDKHLFSLKLRYNQDDQNIPPTASTFSATHEQKQKEDVLLTVLDYKYVEKKYNLLVRTAFTDQTMQYRLDSSVSNHHYYQWINNIKFTYLGIKNLTIKPGIDFTYDQVTSDDYNGMKTRSTTSFYTEINYNIGQRVKTSLVIREDLIGNLFLPVVPALGVEYLPWRHADLSFNLSLARNYRYPTLNDLYWIVSGNPDLKPETNYSLELGFAYNHKSKDGKFSFEINLAGYYSWIYQMITWSPVNGNSTLWKPENIDEILARGIETGLKFKWEVLNFELSLDNNYHFCRSTYEKANSAYDQKIGKQLIYIPVHTINSTASISRWKFYLNYNFCYVSDRYTAKDNLSVMPGYTLSNIIFGKNISLKNFILSLQVEINNLMDLDYQSIADRPMPGINYAFTLKLSLPRLTRQ